MTYENIIILSIRLIKILFTKKLVQQLFRINRIKIKN